MVEQRLMKYNPAFLSDDKLIASFAVRERELDSILEVIRENTGRSNQHVLLIGPRGIGKTTLVRRAAAEVRRDTDLKEKWYPLVYAEESYGVSTPGEFWLEGILHLAEQMKDKDQSWQKTYERLRGERDEQRLCEKALSRLLDFSDGQGKKILLIVENLNMLFKEQMNKDAGWVLRQTLQHENRIMLLGTANQRFDEIEGIDRAWFEMFKIIELLPLSTAECRRVWRKAAGTKLLSGRSKMLKILTGGNPRLLAILIQFAEKMSLKALMDDLIRLVDEHTEYFKSHLDNLPGMERKVFVSLAEIWDPATANEVAEAARVDVSKTSAFLSRLIERGAVEAMPAAGKKKKYQLVERMYNIYYLMRCRGASSSRVNAAVRFMTSWYTPDEIGRVVNISGKEACVATSEERREFYRVCECLLEALKTEDGKKNVLSSMPEELFQFSDVPEKIRQIRTKLLKEKEKKEIQKLTNKFFEYFKNNDLENAEKISLRLSEITPKLSIAWYSQGLISVERKKFKEAEKYYRKAIEVNSDDAWVWNDLGKLLHRNLNNYKEAETAYQKAIGIEPQVAEPWGNLGQLLHEKLNKYEEAEKYYQKAIELKPDHPWPRVQLGRLLHEKLNRYEEAEKNYRKAIDLKPDYACIWYYYGKLLQESLGKYGEAEKAYNKATQLAPTCICAWDKLGELLSKNLGKYEEAEIAYRRVIDILPSEKYPKIRLVEILLRSGKNENALEEAKRGLDVLERSAEFLDKLAEVFGLGENKQYLTQAEGWSHEAVEKEPGAAKYKFTLARIVGRKGVWVESLEVMKDVMEDVELVKNRIKVITDLYVGAAAAGCAETCLKVLADSASADQFEPLIAGLTRFITGQRGMKAKEIEDIAEDVSKRIIERQKELRKADTIEEKRN